ncbi:YggT family protein [Desulfohalotomaculum tongense]|uniref:YggT family protein n=1 Tax=Desulforadius tongensis TaxID=1216062 RepID=UPI001957BACB|nr:YggT family protein [Desulforadius tongensis]MBM7855243.1 YggT family protein [Desulforadius tongensis]
MFIIYQAVDVAFEVYKVIIFARIILSFVKHNPYSPLIRFVYDMTEPYLSIFRRFIPPVGMVDFSPIAALFALSIIKWLVMSLLRAIF